MNTRPTAPAPRAALARTTRTLGRPLAVSTLAALMAAGLTACGGGQDEGRRASASPATSAGTEAPAALPSKAVPAGWTAVPPRPDALMQGLAIPADAPSKGMWSASRAWPFNAIHAVLIPDGRVLTFGTPFGAPGAQDGRFFDIWTPELGFADPAHAGSVTPDPVNSFCGVAGWLGDGTLLVAGGNGGQGKASGIFTTTTNQTRANPFSMAAERWYATMVSLPDARQLILGGTVPYASPITSQTPEVLENGSWRSLLGASSTPIFGVRRLGNQAEANPWYYPRAWVAPNGKVFGITSNLMFTLDPDANGRTGSIQQIGTFKTVQDSSSATTPNVGFTSTAVMFRPGRILQVGGNGITDNNPNQASLNASIIDINGATPVVTETNPMSFRRHWANATVLPDGKVAVTGGTTVGWEPANAVRPAEIWNPDTGTWTVGASNVETRTYHSSALLLPNGTVLAAGGGAPGSVNNLNAELYYPPYLFRTVNGQAQLAERPVVTALSTLQGAYAGALGIEMASTATIAKLMLIQTGAVTHSFNNTQRLLPLNFTQSGSTLTAALPPSANLAPPGYYMVYAVDANGVPSRGVPISLGGLKAPELSPPVIPGVLPANALPCAAENGTCTLPGGQRGTVYYGGRGIFATRSGVTGGIACTNAIFGDPIPGTVKSCFYVPEGPANTSYCGAEGATCSVPAGFTASVFYGANGVYTSLAGLSGTVACNSATFGSDPIPGVTKACFYTVSAAPPPPTPPAVLPSFDAPPVTAGASASYAPAVNFAGASYTWTFGDGSAPSAASASATISHRFAAPGLYAVKLSARLADGRVIERSFLQAVTSPVTARAPAQSSALALEARSGASTRLWVANPDNDTVAVIDTNTQARVAEIAVGRSPRSVALAPDGRVWVSNKEAATISILNPGTLTVVQTVTLPAASRPHGLAFAPGGGSAYVVLEATGQLLKLAPVSGATQASVTLGADVRHLSLSADGGTALVSRFITPALPGESTAAVDTSSAGAQVIAVATASMTVRSTVTLRHSDKIDTEAQGAGIPNYLGAAAIAPDGTSAWVPSKQDNIKRGSLRNGQGLNFQNAVRAISSRIDLGTLTEDLARRVDHDNSSLGTAAVHHPSGAYLFVALETSRQVAVVDPVAGRELAKLDVGRAPQALAMAADGRSLYVQNFMDRSVTVVDLSALVTRGELSLPVKATVGTVGTEKLTAPVLLGKQLFYDARDTRLARDSYMSCASCHNDAGHDGRTWDFTGFGEGLRNTPALKGRAATGQGFVHWSGNFDELQDFEGQIRNFAGGSGLMSDAQFNTGTRSTPLGDRKAGLSGDLDALAAYLASLTAFDPSPRRNADGSLSAAAQAGRTVFTNANCASCHGGAGFTLSGDASTLKNIGTIKAASGQRLGGALTGIDVPTLRDVWATGPYLHDGSAATLAAAVQAHNGNTVAGADLDNLVAYLQQIGSQEASAPGTPPPALGTGTGLTASYFGNETLSGNALLTRNEAPWFDWGTGAPAANVPADNFSVRWTGEVQAVEAGNYQFRTTSDDGVRVWVNGVQLINNWTVHAPTVDTSGTVTLGAGQRVTIVVEFQEIGGGAMLQLGWLRPGGAWAAVPLSQLHPSASGGTGGGTSTPPVSAVACGNEGGTCTLPAGATATVWYGAGATWVSKTGVTGSIACTNAVFGDPLPGAGKACRYVVTSTTGPSTGTGTGLSASYFNNLTLSGTAALRRTENPWFNWGTGSPAAAVRADNFSARWSGQVQAIEGGSYQFRTNSDDGVRVWVNGVQVINNWTVHAPTLNTSGAISLSAGQKVSIVVEYQEYTGGALLQLSWLRPNGSWAQVPSSQLYP